MKLQNYIKASVISFFHRDKYKQVEKPSPLLNYAKQTNTSIKEIDHFLDKYGDFLIDLTNFHLKEKIEHRDFAKIKAPIEGLYLGRDCFIDAVRQIKQEVKQAEARQKSLQNIVKK